MIMFIILGNYDIPTSMNPNFANNSFDTLPMHFIIYGSMFGVNIIVSINKNPPLSVVVI